MAVRVDYLVVYSGDRVLMELLTETLEDALGGVDDELSAEDELKHPITIRPTKTRADGQQIYRFSVEFDTEEERMGALIDDFSESIAGRTDDGIEHLLKLNDPQLRRTLRDYAEEIFEIEMKLREALSLIFVDTYGEDFYALLKDVTVEPTGRRAPEQSQMQVQYENQFFFLLFSNYINVNVRKQLSVERIEEYMKRAEAFEELKGMITAERPITEGRYIDFLDKLKKEVDPIEKLRNCVAHNRSIPEDIIANYEKAKNRLLKEINELLTSQENREEEL
jgi:hypothetical protein